MMDRRQADTFAFITAVAFCIAPVAAAMLGYIAHYNIALSRLEIRIPAVVGAVIIAVVIATPATIEFFCRRLRKP
jgi:membrane protein DedA with SNARE-associated domain